MHLLEKYSFNCGVSPLRLEKPYIFTSYYPISKQNYVVVHPSSGMPSKNYSYFQQVVDFIYEPLANAGYEIVQIGEEKDLKLSKCTNLQGKTNLHQTCFIIKNASLFIGNDSFSTHVSSAYGVPSVSLYSVIQPEVSGPYWKNGKQFTIMAPLMGKKPRYSFEDPDRSIDKIKPEEIIEKVSLALPKIDFSSSKKIKSILIGSTFSKSSMEIVPDSLVPKETFPQMPANIRFDLLKSSKISQENVKIALETLAYRKGGIVTSEPLDINPFLQKDIKPNLSSIILHIKRKNLQFIEEAVSFTKKAKEAGFATRVALIKNNFSQEEINNLKFVFLDIAQISALEETSWLDPSTGENLSKQINDLTIFKSSRIIFSNNKMFLSKAALLEDKPSTTLEQKLKEISNLEELGKELESCYIYNP